MGHPSHNWMAVHTSTACHTVVRLLVAAGTSTFLTEGMGNLLERGTNQRDSIKASFLTLSQLATQKYCDVWFVFFKSPHSSTFWYIIRSQPYGTSSDRVLMLYKNAIRFGLWIWKQCWCNYLYLIVNIITINSKMEQIYDTSGTRKNKWQ
jgi:hypothetical protein